MQRCEACGIFVRDGRDFCPLCGEVLEKYEGSAENAAAQAAAGPDGAHAGGDAGAGVSAGGNSTVLDGLAVPRNVYPDLEEISQKYHFLWRLFIFISLVGCGVSLLIDVMVTPGFWWSIVVIASVVYLWLSVPPLLRTGVNLAKRMVFQALFTCALVVLLDHWIGYRGWSVSFAVPGLLSAGILGIALAVVFNRTSWTEYVFYQVLMGLFGFIPLGLYLLGWAQNLVMVLVTSALALCSLLATFVFGDRTLKHDFKRRFHL